MMRVNKSALLALAVSAAVIAAPALDCAWAKDGSSGSGSSGGGGSGSSGSGSSGSGSSGGGSNSGKGGNGSSGKGDQDDSITNSAGRVLNLRSSRTELNRGSMRLTKKRMPRRGSQSTGSISELQADLTRAQRALYDAELKFNRGLADPKANLRKLEQAIRNAEIAIMIAGGKLARASSGQ
jgi:hypothetical protein